MATEAQKKAYYAKMLPIGQIVQGKIGIPAALVVAFWSWETDFGTNASSKANNHAGIKSNSKGADYAAGIYAGYNSLANFAADYARILSINAYGYPKVLQVAKAGGSYADITKAHNASSWSEADYNVDTIVSRANAISGVTPGKPTPEAAVCPHCLNPVSLQKA